VEHDEGVDLGRPDVARNGRDLGHQALLEAGLRVGIGVQDRVADELLDRPAARSSDELGQLIQVRSSAVPLVVADRVADVAEVALPPEEDAPAPL
jgi:hypothetical protein